MHRIEKQSEKEVLILSSLLQPCCIFIDLNICLLKHQLDNNNKLLAKYTTVADHSYSLLKILKVSVVIIAKLFDASHRWAGTFSAFNSLGYTEYF